MHIRQLMRQLFGLRPRGVSATVASVCLVTLASGGLVGILASQAYDEYVHGAELASAAGANAARSLAAHAQVVLRTAGAAAAAAAAELPESNPADVRLAASRFVNLGGGLADILIVDGRGTVVSNAPGKPPPLGSQVASIAPYLRDHPGVTNYIAPPVRAKGSGDWYLPVVQRLSGAGPYGRGFVAALVPVSGFSHFYDRLSLGSKGALLLASTEGATLIRSPFVESSIGADNEALPLFHDELRNRPEGTLMVRSGIDGVERLYSYVMVDGLPLVAVAGVSTEAVLDEWRSKLLWRAGGVGVLFGCLLVLGLHIQNRIRKSEEDEARLNKAHAELAELNKELEKLVMLDPLTGLSNRRRFDQAFPAEFARAMRNGSMLALLMIDVDFFKRYNDLYGHPEGDNCLRIVSAVVQASQSRPGDLAVRYGGEEMAVLLPHTDLAGAKTVAEKIRRSVEKLQVKHDGNPAGVVTVSIGVNAFVPVRFGHNLQQLIDSADKALYEAKATGRNRVCCGAPIEELPSQS